MSHIHPTAFLVTYDSQIKQPYSNFYFIFLQVDIPQKVFSSTFWIPCKYFITIFQFHCLILIHCLNQHYFEYTILFSLKVSLEQSCNLNSVFSVPQQLKKKNCNLYKTIQSYTIFYFHKTDMCHNQSAYRYFALPNRVRCFQ